MNCGLSRKKMSSCKWPIVGRFHFLELTGSTDSTKKLSLRKLEYYIRFLTFLDPVYT